MAVMSQAQFQDKYGRAPSHSALDVPQQVAPEQSLGQKVTGGLDAVFGGKQIGESVVKAGTNLANLATGGISKFNAGLPENTVNVPQLAGDYLKAGSNFLPGSGKGAGLVAKTAMGAGTGYAMDVGSNLKNSQPAPFTPGVGTAVMGALPVVGAAVVKPATAIVGRLLKGLGSGLSGVSGDTIDKIVSNPEAAQKASNLIAKQGNSKVLEDNARTIINGVSQIKKDAGAAYSKGLDSLSHVDIKPENLKEGFFGALEKHGVSVNPDGKIDFSNAEFLDPRIQQKAETVIHTLNGATDLSGTGVRKLMDQVDSAKFKSAPDGDRQAFNAFMGDLKNGLKEGVNKSTDKLGEINKSYSSDMELTQAAQNILGKVKFKNLPEVVNAANKLEKMFAQKGIEPEVVDKFLTRAGINPSDFKTTEAVRQIGNQKDAANSKGLGVGEVMREVTSAVVTPEMVKNVAIATGLAKEKVEPFLSGLSPAIRNTVLQALLQSNAQTPQQ